MREITASFKFLLFILLCIAVVPLQIIIFSIHKGPYAYIIPQIFHKGVCCIFRIKVIIERDRPPENVQCIYVSNHLSYLDIPVIGRALKASFVAKEDVSSWPIFGFLSNLQQTIFISRERNKASDGRTNLDISIENGTSLILFPEGTSTDGQEVLPFKSSLFSIVFSEKRKSIPIYPFTVKILHVNKHSVSTQNDRDLYSWHFKMDTTLGAHLWNFAKSSGATIVLQFHAPLTSQNYTDRKELAKACQDAVSKGLENKTLDAMTNNTDKTGV